MSLSIIDPIDDLPSVLAGKNDTEKYQYLEMIFGVKIDKRIEDIGYWVLLQNEKRAFFSLKINSLLRIPHEEGQSEYFGNLTSLVGVKSSDDSDILIIFSIGSTSLNNEIPNVDIFCTIKDEKVDVADGIPPGCDFHTGVNIILTQETTRDIYAMTPERQKRRKKSGAHSDNQAPKFAVLTDQFPGGKKVLH